MSLTTDGAAEGAESAKSPAIAGVVASDAVVARAELPLVLLCAGYHLRLINAVRARFDGHAERVLLPVLLWLAARLSDPNAEVARAAVAVLDGLGLATRPTPRSYSLREIQQATGLPRETLRRTAGQLQGFGWIERDGKDQLTVTPRFTDYLWADGDLERLQDLRWTAARLRELSDPACAGICASSAEALAAMRACRGDELFRSIRWATPAVLAPALAAAAVVYLCGYNLRHLLGLMPQFDGDLLQVVLLGELGHRNIAALAPGAAMRDQVLATVQKLQQPAAKLLDDPRRACNALSLATCLNVPYETTRRKLAQLCKRGWVVRDEHGLYWVQEYAGAHFLEFNREQRADMLATAARIEALPHDRDHSGVS
jgi:DNA-binding IclR family transcriptional regulator